MLQCRTIRGQLEGVGSLLPPSVFWELSRLGSTGLFLLSQLVDPSCGCLKDCLNTWASCPQPVKWLSNERMPAGSRHRAQGTGHAQWGPGLERSRQSAVLRTQAPSGLRWVKTACQAESRTAFSERLPEGTKKFQGPSQTLPRLSQAVHWSAPGL